MASLTGNPYLRRGGGSSFLDVSDLSLNGGIRTLSQSDLNKMYILSDVSATTVSLPTNPTKGAWWWGQIVSGGGRTQTITDASGTVLTTFTSNSTPPTKSFFWSGSAWIAT